MVRIFSFQLLFISIILPPPTPNKNLIVFIEYLPHFKNQQTIIIRFSKDAIRKWLKGVN